MIDTIVLYVHNLEKYAQICNALERADSKKGVSIVHNIDKETGEITEYKKSSAVIYHDNDTLRFRSYRDTLHIPSSHYNLAYFINRQISKKNPEGRIEFNFSIPKYKYSTNILQFINYYDTTDQAMYSLLFKFLWEFKKKFVQNIDDSDIEINRIDLCFNQFFPNKNDALAYLELQKVVCMKVAKSDGTPVLRKTSLSIVTKRFSFKIYHKGAEFYANDYKELLKIEHPYNLDQLKDTADRILRYEATFRSTYFSYLFYQRYCNAKVKDRNSIYHYLLAVKKIDGDSQFNRQFHLRSQWESYKETQAVYKAASPGRKLTQLRWWESLQGNAVVHFNFDLFRELYVKFWDYVKVFQLTTMGGTDVIQRKILQLNKDIIVKASLSGKKPKLLNTNKLMFYVALSQAEPLRAYWVKGMITKSTYYLILKNFKKLGLTDFNPDLPTGKPSITYTDYKTMFSRYH